MSQFHLSMFIKNNFSIFVHQNGILHNTIVSWWDGDHLIWAKYHLVKSKVLCLVQLYTHSTKWRSHLIFMQFTANLCKLCHEFALHTIQTRGTGGMNPLHFVINKSLFCFRKCFCSLMKSFHKAFCSSTMLS